MSEENKGPRRKYQSVNFCVALLKSISKDNKATAAQLRARLAAADRLLMIDDILEIQLSSEDTISALGNPNFKEREEKDIDKPDVDPNDAKPAATVVASLFEQLKAERRK